MRDKQLENKVAKLRKEFDDLTGKTAAKEVVVKPAVRSHNRQLDAVFAATDAANNAVDIWR